MSIRKLVFSMVLATSACASGTDVYGAPLVLAARSNGGADHVWRKQPSVVIVAAENDPRLDATYEAIAFWNRTLQGLGASLQLRSVVRSTHPVPAEYLETADIFTLGDSDATAFSKDVQEQPGDIVIVLSEGHFISFTAGLPARGKVLVAIKDGHLPPLEMPNVLRNVIAHELGHAIGLHHNADSTTLMCGRPALCPPDVFASDTAHFFPLTDQEKRQLLRMYPAT